MLKHVWFVKNDFEDLMNEYADSDVIHHVDGKRQVLPMWLLSDCMCFLTHSVFLQQGGKLL